MRQSRSYYQIADGERLFSNYRRRYLDFVAINFGNKFCIETDKGHEVCTALNTITWTVWVHRETTRAVCL